MDTVTDKDILLKRYYESVDSKLANRIYFTGLSTLTNLISPIEYTKLRETYPEVGNIFSSLALGESITPKRVFDLLNMDNFYSALQLVNISPAYFTCTLMVELFRACVWDTDAAIVNIADTMYAVQRNGVFSDYDQNAFNAFCQILLGRLRIFYK